VPTVLKFGSLTLLEHSGPVQASNGIALPLYRVLKITPFGVLGGITFISSFGENRSTGDKQTYTEAKRRRREEQKSQNNQWKEEGRDYTNSMLLNEITGK
jgi:hypothetical protein